MDKNKKIIVFGGIGVLLCLIALVIVLMVKNNEGEGAPDEPEDSLAAYKAEIDSLRLANDRLNADAMTLEFDRLNSEFEQVNTEFQQYEKQKVYLKDDSLVRQYNEAKKKISNLLAELDRERKSSSGNIGKIKELEGKIAELQNEIGTLKGIVKHYLEEIRRLGEENAGLKRELQEVTQKNQTLATQNVSMTQSNAQLEQTVKLAKKLNITNLSLSTYNKKDKGEKNITKAKKLGVSFTVSPNNTAAPGMKTFYVRITSPEGTLLGGGPSFSADGASLASTMSRSMEYDNNELRVSAYWDVNTTLTPGDYLVEVFCDGNRLGSSRFNMNK